MDLLSIFPKDELNFINIHVGIVIKDEEHLEECVEEYLNDKNITFFETTNIKNMNSLFEKKNNFNILLLWNVSNVRDMGGMFSQCSKFNQPLEHWIVEKVLDMESMFLECKKF